MTTTEIDVLIIGAGQAGLATAYHLQSTNLSFLLLDSHARLGDSWRQRYDSLTLFSVRAFSSLPGLPLVGDPNGYPTRDEIADYFEIYAKVNNFPIYLNQAVTQLNKTPTGFQAHTSSGNIYQSAIVIIATGPFQISKIPQLSTNFSVDVTQFSAQTYQNPDQVPDGKVLIVGDGASGRDFAQELIKTHPVLLATGRSRRLYPERILGKSIWWWLDKLKLLQARPNSMIGKLMRKSDPFPARGRRLKTLAKKGVKVLPYLTSVKGNKVFFANGHEDEVRSVIWAVGYKDESDWVSIPNVKDENGNFLQDEGVSPVDNLYFIGRSWQRSRGSALITGVGDDAHFLVRRIQEYKIANSKPWG